MVDRRTVAIMRVKRQNLITHSLCEVAERVKMRPRRKAGIGNPVDSVQHEAAGSLKVLRLRLVCRKVDDFANDKFMVFDQGFDDVGASLGTPVGRLHRVQNHRAIRMKADPVVGEYRIRCVWFHRVVYLDHFDTTGLERYPKSHELLGGISLLLVG